MNADDDGYRSINLSIGSSMMVAVTRCLCFTLELFQVLISGTKSCRILMRQDKSHREIEDTGLILIGRESLSEFGNQKVISPLKVGGLENRSDLAYELTTEINIIRLEL